MAEKTKKRRFISNVSVGGDRLDMASIRSLAQNQPEEFMIKMNKVIEEGKFSWSDVRNLGALYEALADVIVPANVMSRGRTRAIMSSAFPLLSGGLSQKSISDAFEDVPTIAQELVTELEDTKKTTSVASITSDNPNDDRVDEGKDFPEIGAGEERFDIRSKRNGRRISIYQETIDENDVADIVRRCNALGTIAAEMVEEQSLRRICDVDGSGSSPAEPYVYRPSGAGSALYSSTANNPNVRTPSGTRYNTNPLVDTTDLDNVRERMATHVNTRGKPILIPISRCTLLVPNALEGVAAKILGSRDEPAIINEKNNWGPEGRWQLKKLLSSPYLDTWSTNAWYLGWFEKEFIRKWKLRFEYIELTGNTEAYLTRRTAFQGRMAWDTEVGAVQSEYVIQSLSGTTQPS